MLHGMYRRRKLVNVVPLVRHGTLRYDAAAIESLVDIMYRGTENLDTELQSLFYGVRALERWQQRRMKVDDTAAISLQKRRPHNAHIPRKAYQLDTSNAAARDDLTLEPGLRGIILRREYETIDTHLPGDLAHACPRLVANHKCNLGVDTPRGRSICYGLEIGSVTARKDRYLVFPCHRPLLYGYTLTGNDAADNRCTLSV